MSPAAALVAGMLTASNAEELGGWPGICAAEVEALRAEEIDGQRGRGAVSVLRLPRNTGQR
jgi:hypothetical protein